MAEWIATQSLSGFVVDVSAEVVLLARLFGVPVVTFAQPGPRADLPHSLAHRVASAIVATWPANMIDTPDLDEHEERLHHVGLVSRFDGRISSPVQHKRRVLFLGKSMGDDTLRQVTAELRGRRWDVETAGTRDDDWMGDVWPSLNRCSVVVSAAGQNGLADIAASGSRAVLIPQERPFNEQEATARAVGRGQYAEVLALDPPAEEIVCAVERAESSSPRWDRWEVSGAGRRAALIIEEVCT